MKLVTAILVMLIGASAGMFFALTGYDLIFAGLVVAISLFFKAVSIYANTRESPEMELSIYKTRGSSLSWYSAFALIALIAASTIIPVWLFLAPIPVLLFYEGRRMSKGYKLFIPIWKKRNKQ